MMSLVRALPFTVISRRTVHPARCVRLENDAIDQGPVELGKLTANQDEFPAPPGRYPVPAWCSTSALGVGR
jgi:hypothetical protein